jgi:glycosyltransferase involved in cell wall biosynthesis
MNLGIVVAVRNAEATLADALHSITTEVATVSPLMIDIVVIDGDSTDASARIAADTPGVRVISQRGRGLARARNQGIDEVRSDLIAFLDADDRWVEGSLLRRLRALDERPDVIGVVGMMAIEPVPGARVSDRQRTRLGRPRPALTPGALVAHRRAFDVIGGFDETLTIAADSEWFARARADDQPIAVLDELVLHKGARDDSLSTDVMTYRRELLGVVRRFAARRDQST